MKTIDFRWVGDYTEKMVASLTLTAHISSRDIRSSLREHPLTSTISARQFSFCVAACYRPHLSGGIMSVNKVILVGRLGRDPETRYTGGGQAVANFSVATDESYKDRNGERQKRTEWHKIVVWGKQAEIAQQYLKKGSLIFIEGRIQSREWQDKEGQKRTSFEIVANNFRMLGGRAEGAAAGADRKSTRLNSSHVSISYAVFCLKKKITKTKYNT